MAILTLGVSFRRAPIELLERLAFTDDDLSQGVPRAPDDLDGVDGAVILSTCNRVEVYGEVANYHAGFLALKRLLVETRRRRSPRNWPSPLYAHWEQDAADHLFAVASGLDSMVLGETQIYAQVREALRRADGEGAAGPAAHRAVPLPRSRAGRRVRQETSLGAAPDAFVALGADLAERSRSGGSTDREVVVVGAGHDGGPGREAPPPARRGSGPRPQPLPRARAGARPSARTPSTATSTRLPEAMRHRRPGRERHRRRRHRDHRARPWRDGDDRARSGRPLVLLDLAVPRDVEPEIDLRRGRAT